MLMGARIWRFRPVARFAPDVIVDTQNGVPFSHPLVSRRGITVWSLIHCRREQYGCGPSAAATRVVDRASHAAVVRTGSRADGRRDGRGRREPS